MIAVLNPSTAIASDLSLSKHVIAANFTVTAGYSAYVSRYIEIADNITITIGDDSDLEIG